MIQSTNQKGAITRPDYVPQADYEMALKGLAKFNRDEEDRRVRLREQVRSLNEKLDQSLMNLLGKELYTKWTAFKAELRQESLKWPVEKEPSPKYSIGARVTEFFKANRMPVEKMQALAIDRQKTYDKIMDEFYGPKGELKKEKEVDMGSVVPKSNACRPQQYKYPWHWNQHGYSANWNDYQVLRDHQINGQTGLITSELNAIITHGDNYDEAFATQHAQHGTWVHTGQGGILTAYILVESLQDQHKVLAFDEEWEYSWMNSRTRSDIMFHVIHPNVTGYARTKMSEFRLSLNDSGHSHYYNRSFLDYGSFHWAILNSRGPLPANQWVFVRFGSALTLDVTSNDFKVNSKIKAAWNIKTLFILCNA